MVYMAQANIWPLTNLINYWTISFLYFAVFHVFICMCQLQSYENLSLDKASC